MADAGGILSAHSRDPPALAPRAAARFGRAEAHSAKSESGNTKCPNAGSRLRGDERNKVRQAYACATGADGRPAASRSPSALPVGKPVRRRASLFQARTAKPNGRGMLWRQTGLARLTNEMGGFSSCREVLGGRDNAGLTSISPRPKRAPRSRLCLGGALYRPPSLRYAAVQCRSLKSPARTVSITATSRPDLWAGSYVARHVGTPGWYGGASS